MIRMVSHVRTSCVTDLRESAHAKSRMLPLGWNNSRYNGV